MSPEATQQLIQAMADAQPSFWEIYKYWVIAYGVLCVVWAFLGAAVASPRNRSGLGFLLGLFAGPAGLIAAALIVEDGDKSPHVR
jgi:hypothetical protein